MLAAQYLGDRRVESTSVEPTPPAAGQVQIEVAYTGICGTDLHIFHGHMDSRVHDAGRHRPRDERTDRRDR